ncbi:hypothetical protein BGW36DRAFT_402204 [Talaromyces proteolyticus]|uniref:Nitrogen regulatory protein areA GATA-like domain-containing protein n=1 Tax=Talaromyces proteolyticus TaxID=1131652 RepID=A0AAD4KEL1_9EURO|nr:uncharacterized protein BGW36DRAFT_402204 [Talaromyces proteolyticus]KAH8689205.1 hypothetical protein BGW36DRAFT_402204 [Talaromyces proteolyticus]
MTALLPSEADDPLRSPKIQTYFLENEGGFFKEPMPGYYEAEYPSSPPSTSSSFSSSPVFRASSTPPIYTPTLSSLSLNGTSDKEEDDLALPAFDADADSTPQSNPEPVISGNANSDAVDPLQSHPKYPGASLYKTSSDDSSIEEEPDRHVDYLSHEWREEDIWASWRYVVSRKDRYSNGVRLENASWRTWAKSKYELQTVLPESLNWLKDCDVTWLYGPLQTESKLHPASNKSPPPSRLSSTNSFVDRKSILKKKTASEAILQRSLSQHTLLKHAGAILQAQKAESNNRGRPAFARATSDVGVSLSRRLSYSLDSSHVTPTNSTSSGLISPSEKRHIHFNNEVEQCIAVEAKDDEEHAVDPSRFFLGEEDDDEDTESDDGVVMMKQVSPRLLSSSQGTPRNSFSSESKTIAPLPSTTLKYRSDTPEPPWFQRNQGKSVSNERDLSPSPSIETLRPSRPDSNFLLDDDRYYQTSHSDYDFPPDRPWFVDPKDTDELDRGGDLHLTPSGMFMPYEEGEAPSTGVLGRIVDTVNTARDIAHVIWNVGWRR